MISYPFYVCFFCVNFIVYSILGHTILPEFEYVVAGVLEGAICFVALGFSYCSSRAKCYLQNRLECKHIQSSEIQTLLKGE